MTIKAHRKHRGHDEIKREILQYLFDHGPTGITELEYSIEINNGLFKRETMNLLGYNMISYAKPDELTLSRKKRARLSDNVFRLLYITPKGEECMELMNKRAHLLK